MNCPFPGVFRLCLMGKNKIPQTPINSGNQQIFVIDKNYKKNQEQNSIMGRTVLHNSRKAYSYKISILFITSLLGFLPLGSKGNPGTSFQPDPRFFVAKRKGKSKEISYC